MGARLVFYSVNMLVVHEVSRYRGFFQRTSCSSLFDLGRGNDELVIIMLL